MIARPSLRKAHMTLPELGLYAACGCVHEATQIPSNFFVSWLDAWHMCQKQILKHVCMRQSQNIIDRCKSSKPTARRWKNNVWLPAEDINVVQPCGGGWFRNRRHLFIVRYNQPVGWRFDLRDASSISAIWCEEERVFFSLLGNVPFLDRDRVFLGRRFG
jgi:hypothetical protein